MAGSALPRRHPAGGRGPVCRPTLQTERCEDEHYTAENFRQRRQGRIAGGRREPGRDNGQFGRVRRSRSPANQTSHDSGGRAMTMTIDNLDKLGGAAFQGYLVRKDLVRKYSRQYPVPTYVVEFLLGRYCASIDEKEIAEGLEIVEKQLRDRTVRTGEEELFKARARESGTVKLIDIVRARLDAKNDCYVAELPSLALRDVRIDDQLVRDNESMLTDGVYAEATVSYDAVTAQEQGGRPFAIDALRPIQMSKSDVLDVLARARRNFNTQEWIDFLIRSIGLEPAAFS